MTIYRCPTPMPSVPEKSIYDLLLSDVSFDDKHVVFKECKQRKGKSITMGELKLQVNRLGLGLQQKLKLKRGDVVMVILPNSIAFPLAVLACQFAGLAVSLANPAYNRQELRHVYNLVKPKAVITVSTLLINLSRASIIWDKCVVMDVDPAKEAIFVEHLMASPEEARKAVPVKIENLNDTAYLPNSSGTTGLPKAVMITHRNVVSMLVSLQAIPGFYDKPWRAVGVAPFFHAMALLNSVHLPIYKRGSYVAILQRFDPDTYLDVIKEEEIDFANLVPPVLRILMNHPKVKNLNRLELMCVGAAPLDGELQEKAMKVFGTTISQGHGMSETTVGTLGMNRGQKLGSVGAPMPGLELRIVDDDGKDVPTGERGELLVRAGNVFKGYYRNPEATKETFTTDGQWLKTGDIAICDKESGDFAIVDRKKELIKYKGYQVAPAELEGVLLQHPKIAAAAVVGIYDKEQATELPRAYVQLRPEYLSDGEKDGGAAVAREIAEFVASRTSSQKKLRGGVRLLERVPLNPSGKILRKEIRVLAAKEEEQGKREAKL